MNNVLTWKALIPLGLILYVVGALMLGGEEVGLFGLLCVGGGLLDFLSGLFYSRRSKENPIDSFWKKYRSVLILFSILLVFFVYILR
jgi:hypothetical protein